MMQKKDFFDAIDRLDTGQRVALRRAAGKTMADAGPHAVGAFDRCAISVPEYLEERWFASACLYCLATSEDGKRRPMPEIIGHMRQLEQLSESQINRVLGMLDTAWRSDGYLLTKMARLVRMLQQRGHAVDCESLLTDLENWNRSDQRVQRRWCRAIFAPHTATSEETENTDETKKGKETDAD